MKNTMTLPFGITVIYFNDPHKNIYAQLPPDRERAKGLSKRIFKDAMTALSAGQIGNEPQALSCG
ncbi:hypothetical protein FACS1894211_15800 [Clostridia bacterium]|nr:hypothetical protein FACS1894211_15800 [Clostridia bacterium]